jgi:CubicO group peptidase (beta-lactamase class C family)
MAHPSYAKEKGNLKEIDQVIKLISDQDLVFKIPGEKVSYSNSGFVVLGKIIEKVTGKRYCEYLKERIFIPLGMKNSVLPRVDQEISNKALGYVIGASGKAIVTEEIPAFSDGGIHTTVEDLLKYDQALYGNSLLKDETKELMFAGGHSNLEKYRSGRFDNYSYGWGVKDVNGRRFIGHSGGIRGVNATFARFPNEKYTIIILSNFDRAADELGLKVRALIFGEQYSLPKLPVGRFLFNTIKENGIKKISESPDSILQKNGYQILNDQILNSTGYDLLQNKMPSEALEILKQNVRLFPLCSNCFDSLGEAYMVNGDRRNAIVNYAKSLELDPENKNAVEMLNRLTGK